MAGKLNQSNFIHLLVAGLILALLAGCLGGAPEKPLRPPSDEASLAEAALRDFYQALQEGDYEAAAERYGGSYEVLAGMNPDLDPADGPALFAQGCGFNGFTCMRLGQVISVEQTGEGEYSFVAQFLTDAGEVFVLGPCCGADETEMPPVSEFQVRAARDGSGEFKALDLPPYVP